MTLRAWFVQLIGITSLALVVWGFLNMPDRSAWQVGASFILAVSAVIVAGFVIWANLTGTLSPSLRILLVIGCLLLLLALLWGSGMINDRLFAVSDWLASAIALRLKKPVRPDKIHQWLSRVLLVLNWVVIPVCMTPLIVRAAGFRSYKFWRGTLLYIGFLVIGIWLPQYLLHWVPTIKSFWPQVLSMVLRFAIAYAIFLTCWTAFGRLVQKAQGRPEVT